MPIAQMSTESNIDMINDNCLRPRAELIIDPVKRLVYLHDIPQKIPALEFEILLVLANNVDKAVPRSQIMNDVWGSTNVPAGELTSYISRIRKKIEKDPKNPDVIITYHGYGYLLSSKQVECCQSK